MNTEYAYHAMARTTNLGQRDERGRHYREPMTNRRLHLLLSRSLDGTCRICHNTGVYRTPRPAPVFDELKGHIDTVSDEQIAEYLAFVAAYCGPIPCFNPECTAKRPENACDDCSGFGQVRIGNALTDTVCETCDGFGHYRKLAVKEAA